VYLLYRVMILRELFQSTTRDGVSSVGYAWFLHVVVGMLLLIVQSMQIVVSSGSIGGRGITIAFTLVVSIAALRG